MISLLNLVLNAQPYCTTLILNEQLLKKMHNLTKWEELLVQSLVTTCENCISLMHLWTTCACIGILFLKAWITFGVACAIYTKGHFWTLQKIINSRRLATLVVSLFWLMKRLLILSVLRLEKLVFMICLEMIGAVGVLLPSRSIIGFRFLSVIEFEVFGFETSIDYFFLLFSCVYLFLFVTFFSFSYFNSLIVSQFVLVMKFLFDLFFGRKICKYLFYRVGVFGITYKYIVNF